MYKNISKLYNILNYLENKFKSKYEKEQNLIQTYINLESIFSINLLEEIGKFEAIVETIRVLKRQIYITQINISVNKLILSRDKFMVMDKLFKNSLNYFI